MTLRFQWKMCLVAIGLLVTLSGCRDGTPALSVVPDAHAVQTTALPPLVSEASVQKYRKHWAVVVGIDRYNPATSGYSVLHNAVNDAYALAGILENEFGYSGETGGVLLLTDKSTELHSQPTRSNIESALHDWLPSHAVHADDCVLFFFAGHGENDDPGYLATSDADRLKLSSTAISLVQVRDAMSALSCRHKAIILTSCYSGQLFESVAARRENSQESSVSFEGVGQRIDSSTSFYLSQPVFWGLSAGRDRPVPDQEPGSATGHSPFVEALLQHMQERCDSTRTERAFRFSSLGENVQRSTDASNDVRSDSISYRPPRMGHLPPVDGDGDYLFFPTVNRMTPSDLSEHRNYARDIRSAAESLKDGQIEQAREHLSHAGRHRFGAGIEWFHLHREAHTENRVLPHSNRVCCLQFSPDGTMLATGGSGEMRLWDADSGNELPPLDYSVPLRKFEDFTGVELPPLPKDIPKNDLQNILDGLSHLPQNIPYSIVSLAFSLNGEQLAISCDDGSVSVWNVKDRRLEASFKTSTGLGRTLAFSPDGLSLATAGQDSVIRVWDLQMKSERIAFPTSIAKFLGVGHSGEITSLQYSPDGQILATSGKDGTVQMWNTQGQQVASLVQDGPISWIGFSGDGSSLAALVVNPDASKICVWEIPSRNLRATIEGDNELCFAAAISRDGTKVAVPGKNYSVSIWDVATKKQERVFQGHSDLVSGMAFTPDDRVLATSSSDESVRLWRADKGGQERESLQIDDKMTGKGDRILALALSPHGSRLAVCSLGGGFQILDMKSRQPLIDDEPRRDRWFIPESIAFAGLRGDFVAAADEHAVKVFQSESGKLVFSQDFLSPGGSSRITFSSDGTLLAGLGHRTDSGITIWDAKKWSVLHHWASDETNLVFVKFTLDGKRLVTVSRDGYITVRDSTVGDILARFRGQEEDVLAAALSNDGVHLAIGAFDHQITICNLTLRERERTFGGHGRFLSGLDYSTDGNSLTVVGGDYLSRPGTITIFQPSTGEEMLRLTGHDWRCSQAVFAPWELLMASGDDSGVIRFWNFQDWNPAIIPTGDF